jgi:hypothetical protein
MELCSVGEVGRVSLSEAGIWWPRGEARAFRPIPLSDQTATLSKELPHG